MAVIASKQIVIPKVGIMLSDYQEGDIVKIPENGVNVDFYVAQHNYGGSDTTLLVRKNVHSKMAFNAANLNTYSSSSIDSWLNTTYKGSLNNSTQSAISKVTIYYTPGNGVWTLGTLTRGIFLLSATELGFSPANISSEGTKIPIAGILTIATDSAGSASSQWTRTPCYGASPPFSYLYAYGIQFNGALGSGGCTDLYGVRPALTLPGSTLFNENTNIIKG